MRSFLTSTLGLGNSLHGFHEIQGGEKDGKIKVAVCTSYRCSGHNTRGVIKDTQSMDCPDCGHAMMYKYITAEQREHYWKKDKSWLRKKDIQNV